MLIGAEVRGQQGLLNIHDSMDELALLASTAGLEVVGQETQRLSRIHPGTFIGSGKVEELAQLQHELDYGVLVFDDELSPAQLRNLERAIDVRILDRTALILDIFAMHARTREGALQVELAQYAYRLPRLTRQWTHLSRQAVGGVGLRGPGETQLEVDRREIARRMSQLRKDLDKVRQQRGLQRRRRRRQGMPVVAIVGYTNAGKSTLLNRLSDAHVLVQDKLFATLDPTTRQVALPSGKQVLLTDTVGFIQKLPTDLVAAFRATLEEVNEADLLLHVVDVSDPNMLAKIEAVEQVLADLEVVGKPTVIALNKVDLVDPEDTLGMGGNAFAVRRGLLDDVGESYDHVAAVSAQQGVGIDELLALLEQIMIEQMVDVTVTLPYASGDLLSLWHTQGIVEDEQYTPEGTTVRGKLPVWLAGMITGDDYGDGEEKEQA